MKRWSAKTKLTLLYAAFMVLLTCAALAILFSLSNQEILSSVQSKLREQVEESLEDIEGSEGNLKIDSDFYTLEEGVYLSVYDGQDGEFLYGMIPAGFDAQADFMPDGLQTIKGRNESWYVFDLSFRADGYGEVYVRVITSVTRAENSMRVTLRFALILLPLLAAITIIICYCFIRRAFLPVKKMTETVQKIQRERSLSMRVGLPEGKDEIYYLAATFDNMLEDLEESFHRERQFTSDVSHELRTPVTVILMQCEEILQDPALSEEQRRQTEVIKKKAEEISSMISQLLLLSRADQGRQVIQKERLDISKLTEMIVEGQTILAREKEIMITETIEEGIYAAVDESLYIRLLVNLISNSISYGKRGGHTEVSLQQKEGAAVLQVKDDGIGISKEDLPHIWDRFFRADSARSDGSHSGLGLSMVKWIAKEHGGDIEAESVLGEGSRFICRIPLPSKEN